MHEFVACCGRTVTKLLEGRMVTLKVAAANSIVGSEFCGVMVANGNEVI